MVNVMRFLLVRVAFALSVAVTAMPAHATFKCVDEKGITHYGDTLPPACAKRAVTEFSKQGGVVIRKIEAPLTPEQIIARDEERARQRVIQRRIEEQRTKDLALLATFSKETDFDKAKARSSTALDDRRVALEGRLETLAKQLAKAEAESEFYQAGKGKNSKARELPASLTASIARAKNEQVSVTALIKRTEVEKFDGEARFDADRERWLRLKAGMKPGTLDDMPHVEAKPADAPPAKKTASAKR